MASDEKLKALDAAISNIEKQFGKGSIMKLGDRAAVDVEPIPSGSLLLDQALGIGGYPKGRIIEIFGPESSVRQLWLFLRLHKFKRKVDVQLLSMQKMLSTLCMHVIWV